MLRGFLSYHVALLAHALTFPKRTGSPVPCGPVVRRSRRAVRDGLLTALAGALGCAFLLAALLHMAMSGSVGL